MVFRPFLQAAGFHLAFTVLLELVPVCTVYHPSFRALISLIVHICEPLSPTYSRGTSPSLPCLSKTRGASASFSMVRLWMFCVSSPLFASVTMTVTPPLHDIYLRRALPSQPMLSGFGFSDAETPGMTIEECTKFCASHDYAFGGLENGDECRKFMSRIFPREVHLHDCPIF